MDQLRSIIDTITFAEAMKWALVVLVAGFIGQFGRKFAEYLIDRARRKRKLKEETAAAQGESSNSERAKKEPLPEKAPETVLSAEEDAKERQKQEKKKAKALSKQIKKTGKAD